MGDYFFDVDKFVEEHSYAHISEERLFAKPKKRKLSSDEEDAMIEKLFAKLKRD